VRDSSEAILDELVVLRCRRGDHEAWEMLVRRYERRLLYYLRRLINSERDAYDVLQQTWMSAVKSLPGLRQPRALRVWLYRIARNQAADHLRRRGIRIDSVDPIALDHIADDACGEAARTEWLIDAAEEVHAALARLSLPHREVLTLHFLEDASIEDIAAVLKVPPGTVKSRIHYAKRALRDALQHREVE
jgi:RNA polymerase sigma-70 factor (ECF subfamily)